jgi:microcystin-dependent protein
MPNIPQQQTIVQYTANVSQTQYTFAFYAVAPNNIAVYYQASNATPVPAADILTLGVDYTVTFNSDPTTGGYITLLFTPTTGYYLTITLQLLATLNTNFANAQNFNGANLDAALDYLLMLIQQVTNYAYNRNLSYVINTYLPNAVPYTQLPPLAQNYVWIGSGSGVVAAQIATVPSASVLQSMLANNSPDTDGALLVGYYNATTSTPTTVDAILTYLLGQTAYLIPPGAILDYGGGTVPVGFLLCDGRVVSRTIYAALFTAIGTIWGVGDGSTTFNLPNFQRCTSVGSGGTGTGVLGNTVGSTGGEETHLQQISEMPAHTHVNPTGRAGTGPFIVVDGQFANDGDNLPTNSTGGSTPFNVIQPSNVVTKMIKY